MPEAIDLLLKELKLPAFSRKRPAQPPSQHPLSLAFSQF
jgi:hypothetical protein